MENVNLVAQIMTVGGRAAFISIMILRMYIRVAAQKRHGKQLKTVMKTK